jgi:hypothetical protein
MKCPTLQNRQMSNFTVRRAQARDSNELSKCIDAAYLIYSKSIDDLPEVFAGIADAIERNRVWVTEVGPQTLQFMPISDGLSPGAPATRCI